MPLSLDFASLRRAYAEGAASPVSVAREIARRIAARGNDAVWISRVPDDAMLMAAAALERRAAALGRRAGAEGRAAVALDGVALAVTGTSDGSGAAPTPPCPR